MIGTIANTIAILVGSFVGGAVRQGLKQKYQDMLFVAMGLAATGLGINAVVQNMPNSSYPVLFIASLALGGAIGTGLDLDRRFNDLVNRKGSKKAPNTAEANKLAEGETKDAETAVSGPATIEAAESKTVTTAPAVGESAASEMATIGPAREQPASKQANNPSKGADNTSTPNLGRGLSTAIMLFCVGTLSILGPINSALYGDETFLFTNAMLDLVTSMVLASTFGFGIAIAAGVLFCWQGAIYLLASFLSPLLSGGLMCEISIVGGFLIFASGLSILKIREISTMNLLPALFIPPLWFALLSLTGNFGGLL